MTKPLLCSTVFEPSMAALRARRDAEARHADVVELRLDAVSGPIDVAHALAGRTKPVIVTCRRQSDGGKFAGGEEQRRHLLSEAIRCGAEYVDVEWDADFRRQLIEARQGSGVVLSMHDFGGIPRDIMPRVRQMLAEGAQIVKIATTARRLSDCIELAVVAAAHRDRSLAVVAMGPPGIPTRVLPARFGSCLTYAGSAAPGQISAADLLRIYRFNRVGPSAGVYGVAGSPVTASLSPAMHNAWFAALSLDAVYLPLDTADADDLFRFAEWLPLEGASITAPLKTRVGGYLRDTEDCARKIGAVNTIRRVDGEWLGTNTDCEGFLAPLEARGVDVRLKRAAIIGAGGAARAAATSLAAALSRVSVYARRLEAAAEVAALAGGEAAAGLPPAGSWDLLINATPVRWDPASTGLLQSPPAGAWVYDLISNPPVTKLLSDAAAAGCGTISGLEMLVAQAELQAEWWTGRRPASGLMVRAALAAANSGQ